MIETWKQNLGLSMTESFAIDRFSSSTIYNIRSASQALDAMALKADLETFGILFIKICELEGRIDRVLQNACELMGPMLGDYVYQGRLGLEVQLNYLQELYESGVPEKIFIFTFYDGELEAIIEKANYALTVRQQLGTGILDMTAPIWKLPEKTLAHLNRASDGLQDISLWLMEYENQVSQKYNQKFSNSV